MSYIEGLLALTFWEKFVNFHGLVAMLSLILFGAGIVLYYVASKHTEYIEWLKGTLLLLFLDLVILDVMGLSVYVPYRAADGPRTFLKSSESTAWLHGVIFEHKEFTAFAPPLMILAAFLVVSTLGKNFNNKEFRYVRKAVIFSLVAGLVYTLIVAAEAVLVTKAAAVV